MINLWDVEIGFLAVNVLIFLSLDNLNKYFSSILIFNTEIYFQLVNFVFFYYFNIKNDFMLILQNKSEGKHFSHSKHKLPKKCVYLSVCLNFLASLLYLNLFLFTI